MGRAGFAVVVLGVAGLFAHLVISLPPAGAGAVTGGSWVAIGIGAVLLLTSAAQNDYGYGVFPLALGLGALIAQQVTHFDERVHAPQPLLGIVIVVLIGVGAVAVAYSEGVDDALIRLPVFALASLAADIFVDFGPGWDELLNVSTASFAAAFVVTAAAVIYFDGDLSENAPVIDHYGAWLLLAAGIGAGVATVLVTVVASFALPGFVAVLLTVIAVLGGYLVVPLLWSLLLYWRVGGETFDDVTPDVARRAFGDMENRFAVPGTLVAGLVPVAALVVIVFGDPPGWLIAVLATAAVAGAAVAARCAQLAIAELAALLRSPVPRARIAEALERLRRTDPVFRLLPGAETPRPR